MICFLDDSDGGVEDDNFSNEMDINVFKSNNIK